MSKWTQEQRQAAVNQWDAMMPNFTSYHNMGIELACQRNELLEALKAAEGFVDRHSEDWYLAGQTLLAEIRAAIAKAEGK